MTVLHVYHTEYNDRLRSLVQESYERLHAIHTLLQGYSPIHLVPPETLRPILTLARRMLQTQFPNFVLTHSEVATYYQVPITLYSHSRKYLYITLRLPVTTSDSLYKLYKLSTLPVPLAHTESVGYTQIIGHSPYLTIATTRSYFFELNLEDLSTFSGTEIKHCSHFFPSQERDALTCTAAFFTDNIDVIPKLCRTQLFPETPYPRNIIRDLGSGSLFVNSIDQTWVKTCPINPLQPFSPANSVSCIWTVLVPSELLISLSHPPFPTVTMTALTSLKFNILLTCSFYKASLMLPLYWTQAVLLCCQNPLTWSYLIWTFIPPLFQTSTIKPNSLF